MAPSEEEISPEEKLLNVIKSGGEEDGQADGTVDVAATIDDQVTVADADPAEIGADAVTMDVQDTVEAEDVTMTAEAAAPSLTVAPPLVADKQRASQVFGVRAVNRFLVAAIVLMLLVTGVNLWGKVRDPGMGGKPLTSNGDIEVIEGEDSFDLVMLLNQIDGKDIYRRPVIIDPTPDNPDDDRGPRPIIVPSVPWQTYVKKNIKLMGMSPDPYGDDDRVILVDEKVAQMYVLKVGQRILAGKQEIKVQKVTQQVVTLSDLNETSKIELQ